MTPKASGPSIRDEARAVLSKHAKVDRANITGEYAAIPAILARWQYRLSVARDHLWTAELEAKERKARAKLEAEIAVAKIQERVRDEKKHQRPNADAVDAMVRADHGYERSQLVLIQAVADAERALNVARVEEETASAVVKIFEAKREMVVNMGAHLRREFEGMPSIRERPRR